MSDPILDLLDPEQYRVATSLERPVVALAAAGSGKTRAITHRIAYAVREGVYHAQNTLAVTFTTRAAGEMRARLAQLGVPQVQARTFHAAALRQCQYFWPQVYNTEFPPLEEDVFQLVARATHQVIGHAETALVKDLETEIVWAKSNNVAPAQYAELAQHRTVAGVSDAQVGAVLVAYEKHKSARGVVDFTDLLLCAAHLLAEHPDVAAVIRDGYRHFVVDEYQDVSAIQHRLIELWVNDRPDVCVVGDPQQAIHGFAGADPQHLLDFAERDDVDVVRLANNYRSTPQICDLGNRILQSKDYLRPVRGGGDDVVISSALHEAAEASDAIAWLVELHNQGLPWREMAVLYRINAQTALLEAALKEGGIPYVVRGVERFYQRTEVAHVIGRVQQAASRNPDQPAAELIEQVWASAGWQPTAPSGVGRQREIWESLFALRHMVLEAELGTAAEVAAWLTQQQSWEQAPVADAVTLSTMHAAKGLEWDAVAIIGVREGLVPFSLCLEEPALSEERRLLHVAVTRARQLLRVSWPASASGRGNPSRFLDGVAASRNVSRPSKPVRRRNCKVCGAPLRGGQEVKLQRHVECAVDVDESLFEALREWRLTTAQQARVPAFVVFTDVTLQAIAENKPLTEREFLALPGIGQVKWQRYGAPCLELIHKHCAALQTKEGQPENTPDHEDH